MPNEVKTITVQELKKMMDEKKDFQLIDVREQNEYDFCNIGGELIPMGQIMMNMEKISKEKMVIMQCRSGSRSGRVVAALQAQYGLTNLYNLDGGILAWSEEIDPSIPQY
jgi:rhodanese-related sulfurtransferase